VLLHRHLLEFGPLDYLQVDRPAEYGEEEKEEKARYGVYPELQI